jgi:dTDP-4-dehydrorhamnose reductase
LRLLVVGASGQLGAILASLARREGHEVYGTYKSRPLADGQDGSSYQLDKTSRNRVEELIHDLGPQVVVDTGALHNVDYCEGHPDEAMAVNRDGTRYLADSCRGAGAKLIFVSTDYVFDGSGAPYPEQSEPAPLNAYGRSKLEGERVTLSSGAANVVVRSSVVYSWVRPSGTQQSSSGKTLNFGGWLISQLSSRHELRVVDDQMSSPTLADDLAGAILSISTTSSAGIFHTAGATPLSRYDFSVRVAKRMGFDHDLIRPIKSAELKQLARRPINSTLLSNRITNEVGYRMMPIDEALNLLSAQAKQGVVA